MGMSQDVEHVRHKGKGDVVGPVEVAQDLEERTPEPGVPGRVARKGRSEVRTVEVAGGSAERREGRLTNCSRVAIAGPGRTRSRVRFPDASDGPPELVIVFGVPDRYPGVSQGDVDQREEPR